VQALPNASQILHGLSLVANQFLPLALAWHVAITFVIGAIAVGLRPSRRSASLLLVTPLASVSALAWTTGNPFNGAFFASLVVTLDLVGAEGTSEHGLRNATGGEGPSDASDDGCSREKHGDP
jgi:hypothetical protein